MNERMGEGPRPRERRMLEKASYKSGVRGLVLVSVLAAGGLATPAQGGSHEELFSPRGAGALSAGEGMRALGLEPGGGVFLPPELAFVLSVESQGSDTVIVRWQLADTYYLYRDKLRFAVADPSGIELDEPRLPAGLVKRDDYFGEVEVYYGELEAALRLRPALERPQAVTLELGYQGCTDKGLCYPPMVKRVAVTLPANR